MTNIQSPLGQSPSNDSSRPLRRPGWGLIQDINPSQKQRKVASVQSEAKPMPATTTIPRNLPIAVAKTKAWHRRLILLFQKHALIIIVPLIIIVSIRLSTLPAVGEIIIIVYGLLAIIRRIPSRITFLLATLVLASIGIEFLLLPGSNRVNNSALFVFLLLCVGLLSLMLETRRITKHNRTLRRR